ncbi:hypothetical protein LCGC14_0579150 [marine sediment metagenome]|uniref:Uncharacterized protein n=1 Tax=marine sediment metagenome TaxID=412755 RepID=A0A0F9U3B9_9ZZZZ
MGLDLPKTFDFGGTELVEIKHLETTFGISHRVALKYLHVLHIKPMHIGNDIFFSLQTFNRIMFVLSRPGSPGFLFPGSKGKKRDDLREDENYLVEVTEDILKEASTPQILAEMAAASGRDNSMIKKLISADNAKSRKEPK